MKTRAPIKDSKQGVTERVICENGAFKSRIEQGRMSNGTYQNSFELKKDGGCLS